jgi:hypothetical protein
MDSALPTVVISSIPISGAPIGGLTSSNLTNSIENFDPSAAAAAAAVIFEATIAAIREKRTIYGGAVPC